MLLQTSDGLHHGTFKVCADAHNFACSLHLSCEGSLGCYELIKWKPWELNYAVVKGRLKACIGLACDGIFNLIKGVTKCNLGSNLGDRISGCLTCKS